MSDEADIDIAQDDTMREMSYESLWTWIDDEEHIGNFRDDSRWSENASHMKHFYLYSNV